MWGYIASALVGVVGTPLLLDRLFPWIARDIIHIFRQVKCLIGYTRLVKTKVCITDILERYAQEIPNKTLLIFQDNVYTYGFMNEQVNRIAHVGYEKLGLKSGDSVALLAYNGPEFVWTFYGLLKIGVRIAFLNYNLRAKSLLHSLAISGAKAVFIGPGDCLIEAIQEIQSDIGDDVKFYTQGQTKVPHGYQRIDAFLEHASITNPDKDIRGKVQHSDTAGYIYTSGTTGLPKAAIITHLKVLKAGCIMKFFDINQDDIIYTPLPLYHSAASLIGLGSAVVHGATIVIREKFSAREYWNDCCRHNVTIIQYIGELCRYLVNTAKNEHERLHKIRLAFGNGLRKDVWLEFQERFKIPVIGEFYASTEGNAGLMNVLNIPGSVGRLSPIMRKMQPISFIKYDFDTAEPVRNAKGFCERVEFGKPGLMVAPVRKNFEYDGYQGNEEVSKRKIIRNVFKEGDVYINSGDLFTQDNDYNIYFCDRIGDTFRWKGENVSTIEVSNTLTGMSKIQDANVYGVQIPGYDGRTGMAAVVLNDNGKVLSNSDFKELFQVCSKDLAAYALPRFIRIPAQLKMTSTHKQVKGDFVKEGFDPSKCQGDPLFYADFKEKTYHVLDSKAYTDILNGKIKL